jgi:hypothetical protein
MLKRLAKVCFFGGFIRLHYPEIAWRWHGFVPSIDEQVSCFYDKSKRATMKKFGLFGLLLIALSLSSCELVGDIFEAGVWVGVIAVVGVIALVFFLISRAFGRK